MAENLLNSVYALMLKKEQSKLQQQRQEGMQQDAQSQQTMKDLLAKQGQIATQQIGRDKIDIDLAKEQHKRKMDMQKAYWTEVTNRMKAKAQLSKEREKEMGVRTRHGEGMKLKGLAHNLKIHSENRRASDAKKGRDLRRELGLARVGATEDQTVKQQMTASRSRHRSVLATVRNNKASLIKQVSRTQKDIKLLGTAKAQKDARMAGTTIKEQRKAMETDLSAYKYQLEQFRGFEAGLGGMKLRRYKQLGDYDDMVEKYAHAVPLVYLETDRSGNLLEGTPPAITEEDVALDQGDYTIEGQELGQEGTEDEASLTSYPVE